MNSHATATIGVGRPEFGDGLSCAVPWKCWEEEISEIHPLSLEEEISEIHPPSLTAEDEHESHLRVENCVASNDVADDFWFDISDAFPGATIDVQSLFSSSEEIDLPDLFDGIDVEPETSSPLLYSMEKNTQTASLTEPSLQLLTDYGNDFMMGTILQSLWNPDGEEEVSMAAVGDEGRCESSLVDSDSCEEISLSRSCESECKSAYFESSAEENKSVDDEDWMTRKRKRNGKKSRAREPRRKSKKLDPKSRKKEQNRNAATRYREKKKVMEQETQAAVELLEIRNRELRKEIQDKEQEVRVIRQLLVDILRPSS